MFQMFLFFICSLQVFYVDVVYVSHVYCNYFNWMLHMFAMVFKSFHMLLQVFQTLLQVFQLFYTNVASVSSGCSKVIRDIKHVAK
jgi:hypothetical protein